MISDFNDVNPLLEDEWESNSLTENRHLNSDIRQAEVKEKKKQDDIDKVLLIEDTSPERENIDYSVKFIKKEPKNDEDLEDEEWKFVKSRKKRKSDKEKESDENADVTEKIEKNEERNIDKKFEDPIAQDLKLYSWKDKKVELFYKK